MPAVRVRALAGHTVLCSWARHLTLTVPLSTQKCKWVPMNCWRKLTNCGGVTCDGLASRPGGVEILVLHATETSILSMTEMIHIGELFLLPQAPKTAIFAEHLPHLQW